MKYPVAITVNGRLSRREVEARTLLVDFLRDELGLTGTHVGCDTSQCGACTVACTLASDSAADSRLLKSCTFLAVQADGAAITTLEGLAGQDSLGALARNLLDGCAFQCGFCAPGVVLVASELVQSQPTASTEDIQRALQGVLCRCGAYHRIVEGIRACLAGAAGPETNPIVCRENPRFLAGHGEFLDDIGLVGTLHVELVRCPHPHAQILAVEASRARSMAGVVDVFTHDDLAPHCDALGGVAASRGSSTFRARPALAAGTARFAGEAVVAVVARTRALAADAAGLVDIHYQPLERVLDAALALEQRSSAVQGEGTSNLANTQAVRWGDVDAVFLAADRVVRHRWVRERWHSAPLETRGALACWQLGTAELCLWTSTQSPHEARAQIAAALRLDENSVRVIVPDVGGAPGSKLGVSTEELLVAALARQLAPRPVKWVETRRDSFLAGPHGRGSSADVELAVREDGRLLGLRLIRRDDLGAYLSVSAGGSSPGQCEPTGAYGFLAGSIDLLAVLTNKTPTLDPLSTGADDLSCALEGAVDLAAAELELDPLEVRRHNLVDPPPGDDGLATISGSLLLSRALDKLVEVSRYKSLRVEQAKRRQAGELVGVGVALNPGRALISPMGMPPDSWATATVRIRADGSVEVLTSAVSSGQGHETTLAAIAADALGVTLESVRVRRVDTAAMGLGVDTPGARSIGLIGSAVQQATRRLERKLRAVAARMLRVSEDYVERLGSEFFAAGRSARYHDVCAAAHAAHPGASFLSPGLEETAVFAAACVEPAVGAHLCSVRLDGETGSVAIERYVAVEDVGRMLHPGIFDGQLRGAITQGLSLALGEALDHDQDGQQLTTSLLDYSLPRASLVPHMEIVCLQTPSTSNPLGVRDPGAGASTAALAASVNAVLDALRPMGVRHLDPPLRPEKVWRAMVMDLARRST